MILSPEEGQTFYRIWWPLLQYVNAQKNLVPAFEQMLADNCVDKQEAVKLRGALWEGPALLDGFVAENPAGLGNADLDLAASWKQRLAGKFIIMRHLKKYSIFLNMEEPPIAYGVLGILSPFDEVVHARLPHMVDAVLLPWGDKIIYDSLILPYGVSFGSGIRKSFDLSLRRAQESMGVITSLSPASNSSIKGAIESGNKKIFTEFRKDLFRSGLSDKMLQEHCGNVEQFVFYLSRAKPPRSLLNIDVGDLEDYFAALNGAANRVSFKRLVRFLADSERIPWDIADMMEKFLKKK